MYFTFSMAEWAMVRWIQKDRISVIPTSWIVKPTVLELVQMKLPALGSCYWRKKSCVYKTEIIEVSSESLQ